MSAPFGKLIRAFLFFFFFLILRSKSDNIVADSKKLISGRIILFYVVLLFSSTMDVIITGCGNILQGYVYIIDNDLILSEKY
jgi:hypothetical protein